MRLVEITGDFIPRSKAVDFNIRLSDFELGSVNPYIGDVARDLTGKAQLNLTLDGTLSRPQLNGI